MNLGRSAAPVVVLVAAIAGLFGTGQISEAGLERVARATWRVVTSFQQGEFPSRTPREAGAPLTGRPRIIDGDTLDLGQTRIRMQGIDALEHDQRCTRRGEGSYECGNAGRDALIALVGGRTVTCTPDGTETYGRVVAVCTVPAQGGGVLDLNGAMVRSGYAFDCPRFSNGRYADEERAAKAAGAGAWAGRFDFPWAHRDRANACGRG
ncbi:thermonuclease family protein [Roseomonas aerophila]|uniref:Thermonuclease family protein n=1 Tax=Teichococcus aerophilus TaxID=1224513 RepID=A0ABR7RNV4_9PROT|nr:thermonuclease family protein [Pseudoroseomonas aerophila]MBC9208244.1 thermonuclease family protein [Pseudoroseomonas aerophila]